MGSSRVGFPDDVRPMARPHGKLHGVGNREKRGSYAAKISHVHL